uniref:Transposase, MuDR, MULE transposase domain protein n=1 Tax=Tanacetum cinerariifolium TaxID=118510 RepID=A0A6L2K344_TANCI|nr:transposase, MuDR, MULE transposase domain protein [Tanacetum cinerariifolium]
MSSEGNSYSCDEIVLDIFYNGCFVIYPFNYDGDALELKIFKVNKLSYKEMCDLLVEKVNEDIWHRFYCKPDCCLEERLTIVENDRDAKIIYEMANLHGHLEVYVANFPQYLVIDYYLKNLCVDETDNDVTKQLLSHQKIYKEASGLSLKEKRAWKKEQSSPCYLISPNPLEAKCFPIDLKGKSLLDDFEKVEGEG